MMHYEQYVVAITDNKGKSYREFESERLNHGRKSKIYLPFNSEYKILIKNNSDRRIKMDIDIDGTSVSGMGGLIMNAHSTETLERFVDVAKKFLFVRKNDERVSDPSSGDNGILKIRIEKEVSSFFPTWTTTTWPNVNQPPMWHSDNTRYLVSPANYTTYSAQSTIGMVNDSNTAYSCNCSMSMGSTKKLSMLTEESGATVEGGNSNQQFTTTTWAGTDGVAYEFVFKLLGQNGMSDEDRAEYQKYLELKKKFG